MKRVFLGVAFAATHLLASAATTEFPDGATALSADELKEAVAGKVFDVVPDSGPNWRWEFKEDGHFFINVANMKDTGPWSTKDSALCTQGKYIGASCNEVRKLAPNLYLKRDNGNVVQMSPK